MKIVSNLVESAYRHASSSPSSLSSWIVTWENSIDWNKQFSEIQFAGKLEKKRERGNSIAKRNSKQNFLQVKYIYIYILYLAGIFSVGNFFFFTFNRREISVSGGIRKYRQDDGRWYEEILQINPRLIVEIIFNRHSCHTQTACTTNK